MTVLGARCSARARPIVARVHHRPPGARPGHDHGPDPAARKADDLSAPTLIFEADGRRLEAGGHQPLDAYDVLVANLDPGLRREPAPDGPLPLLERFPHGLTTREVAVVLAPPNEEPDDRAAASALLDLVAEDRATREPLGGDALWRAAG